MKKDINYFLKLNYPIIIKKCVEDKKEYYFAEVPDLPGCIADGETPEEVMNMIEAAKEAWISARLEDGYEVPEPRNLEDFSGKFVLRVPKSLHRELSLKAADDGVSLNQYVVELISESLGRRKEKESMEKIFKKFKEDVLEIKTNFQEREIVSVSWESSFSNWPQREITVEDIASIPPYAGYLIFQKKPDSEESDIKNQSKLGVSKK